METFNAKKAREGDMRSSPIGLSGRASMSLAYKSEEPISVISLTNGTGSIVTLFPDVQTATQNSVATKIRHQAAHPTSGNWKRRARQVSFQSCITGKSFNPYSSGLRESGFDFRKCFSEVNSDDEHQIRDRKKSRLALNECEEIRDGSTKISSVEARSQPCREL